MMAAYKSQYNDGDSDADDEFERSIMPSPTLPPDDFSPTDSEGMTSSEHTPTTYTHSHSAHSSPKGLITQWTAEMCADWIAGLGLSQYAGSFIDEAINGEALVEMQHQDLKELGITSVGHRLTLLKGVFDIKIKQDIPFDPDHYVPLSAEGNAHDQSATQDDIARVIESIRLRDQRILAAEQELRVLREHFERISEENRKLREDTLPVIRMVKDRSQPLPNPEQPLSNPPADLKQVQAASNLSRKFSTKKLFLGSAPKNPSPTVHGDNTSLDPSAAAMAASSHLNMNSQVSPNMLSQPSPTSPAYSQQASSAGNRSFPRDGPGSARSNQASYAEDPRQSYNSYTPSTANVASRRTANTSTPVPPIDEPPNSAPLPGTSTTSAPSAPPSSSRGDRDRDRDRSDRGDKDNPQVEIFKSFRVSIEDPCHKVLPVALKRYNIADDWRQYALYIVYGDQERCLGLEEKPLMLFKQLDREGKKPMFMLRKHAAPPGEGWHAGRNEGHPGGGGADGRQRERESVPGGVL